MRCKIARKKISLLIDGRLNEAERRGVESHLEACESCRAEAKSLKEVTLRLEMLDAPEPRDGGWERLVGRTEAAQPVRRRFSIAYAAGFVLILLAVALLALLPQSGQRVVSEPERDIVRTVEKAPVAAVPPPPAPREAEQPSPKPAQTKQAVQPKTPERTAKLLPRVRPGHATAKVKPKPSVKDGPSQAVENQVDEEHVEEIAQAPQSNEISSEADRLLATGLSVLVEASAAESPRNGGDHL